MGAGARVEADDEDRDSCCALLGLRWRGKQELSRGEPFIQSQQPNLVNGKLDELPTGEELQPDYILPVLHVLRFSGAGKTTRTSCISPWNCLSSFVPALGCGASDGGVFRLCSSSPASFCRCLRVEGFRPPTAVRLRVEENQLVGVFGEIGIQVNALKGA